jgi:protein-S-isoprenylcysteine O-methyltransferase Ste14
MRRFLEQRVWLGDLLARGIVSGLLLALAANLLSDFEETGRVTGLLLLASELLVAVLMTFRRRTLDVDRSWVSLVLTSISVAGPFFLRSSTLPSMIPDAATVSLSAFGLLIVIAGKVTLGRSFGIVPANRGVVTAGPYSLVRHPIYFGYLLTHIAFVAAHPLLRNMLIVTIADAALVGRALREEQTLEKDERYQAYCRRVAWHVVPGLF